MSLMDIAPRRETVDIDGTPVTCHGISMGDIAELLARFPAFRALLWGVEAQQGAEALSNPAALVRAVPEAVGPLIAAGTGYPGDSAAEKFAASLPLDSQVDLLVPIFRLTMPDGLSPLARKLTVLFGVVGDNTPAGSDNGAPLLPNGAGSNGSTQPQSSG